MNISQNKIKKRKLVITLVAIVLLGGAITLAYHLANDSTPPRATDEEITEDQTSGKSANNDPDDLPSKEVNPQDSKNSTPNEATPTPSEETLNTPTIERASQAGTSIRVVASFTSSSSGKCRATFTSGNSENLVYTRDISVSPSGYACSFVIPSSDFASSTTWSLSLYQFTGDSRSPVATQTLVVKQ